MQLFAVFKDQGIIEPFSEKNVKSVFDTLLEKMLNLRKKDMHKSWERIKTQKRGGKSITLNLKDELKPYATKKELITERISFFFLMHSVLCTLISEFL